MIKKNKQFYKTFPLAKENVNKITKFLKTNEVFLPNGDLLTLQRFQQLGLNLGFSDGMATLNFYLKEHLSMTSSLTSSLKYSFIAII